VRRSHTFAIIRLRPLPEVTWSGRSLLCMRDRTRWTLHQRWLHSGTQCKCSWGVPVPSVVCCGFMQEKLKNPCACVLSAALRNQFTLHHFRWTANRRRKNQPQTNQPATNQQPTNIESNMDKIKHKANKQKKNKEETETKSIIFYICGIRLIVSPRTNQQPTSKKPATKQRTWTKTEGRYEYNHLTQRKAKNKTKRKEEQGGR